MMKQFSLSIAIALSALLLSTPIAAQDIAPVERSLIDRISADSMRGHLSFLASDLLEGRDTPSKGLDIAAAYIAAQFRRIGLEPIAEGEHDYFQMSSVTQRSRDATAFRMVINAGPPPRTVPVGDISLMYGGDGLQLEGAPLHWLDPTTPAEAFPKREDGAASRPVLVTDLPDLMSLTAEEVRDALQAYRTFFANAQQAGAAMVVAVDPNSESGVGLGSESRQYRNLTAGVPFLRVHGEAATALRTAAEANAQLSLHLSEVVETEVPVKNVAGILRGSDPERANEFILITAHYDHVGRGRAVNGDDIYNGANDDASGTTSVLELARAFAALPERPKRSLLFLCFYGEESGLLGSRHYGEHPIVPLKNTIAMVNLEHMGRTDDSEGPSERRLMPTGFDFSTLSDWFVRAGSDTGVAVFHHPRNSGSFFSRSDNIAIAAHGIPAHTFCTAFIFPDYHGAGDHWDKIDYDNMAAVNRTMALGLWRLANDAERPQWNADHPSTGRYVEAWKALHGEE